MEYLSVFSPNAGKCGQNVDQSYSKYGLKEYCKHLSIAHMSTKIMSSTFDEFQYMIIENQLDVTLPKTWLGSILDYVKIPGYNIILFTKTENRNVVVE